MERPGKVQGLAGCDFFWRETYNSNCHFSGQRHTDTDTDTDTHIHRKKERERERERGIAGYQHGGALLGTPGSVCPQPEPNATELPRR